MRHLSVANGRHSVLFDRGACCVAQYYRSDYELIRTLTEVGCHGVLQAKCERALLHMWQRRQHYRPHCPR